MHPSMQVCPLVNGELAHNIVIRENQITLTLAVSLSTPFKGGCTILGEDTNDCVFNDQKKYNFSAKLAGNPGTSRYCILHLN